MGEISEQLRNPLSLFDVKGKVAIITGASGSFGRGCALALASMGAKLCLASGSEKELAELAGEVKEVGGECVTIARRPDSMEDAQAILDGEARGDDEEAACEPLALRMTDGVDGLPGDEHRHDRRLTGAGTSRDQATHASRYGRVHKFDHFWHDRLVG